MVRCKHLKFGQFTNSNIEPFFVSISLFDVVKQKKLSETFYFDLPENPSTYPQAVNISSLPLYSTNLFLFIHNSQRKYPLEVASFQFQI